MLQDVLSLRVIARHSRSVSRVVFQVLLASLPVWFPIALVAGAVFMAVGYEVVLGNRVVRSSKDLGEPSAAESPQEPGPLSAGEDAPESSDGSTEATMKMAVSETVRSLMAQIGDRRLDREEAYLLLDAVAREVSESVGIDAGFDADQRARLEGVIRDEVGRELTGLEGADAAESAVTVGGPRSEQWS